MDKITLTIDGETVSASKGATILDIMESITKIADWNEMAGAASSGHRGTQGIRQALHGGVETGKYRDRINKLKQKWRSAAVNVLP